MVAKIVGRFREFDGQLVTLGQNHSPTSIALTISASSIDTNDVTRDKHLTNVDFFDAENFPLVTFRSTSFNPVGENRFDVTGTLEINGIRQERTFTVLFNGVFEHPLSKNTIASFEVKAEILRKEFNVGLSYPGAALGEAVTVDAAFELIKQ